MKEFQEKHNMRYFFVTEMKLFLGLTGFKLIVSFAWMTNRRPDLEMYCACFVASASKASPPVQ